MAIIFVHPKASSLQIRRRKCNLYSHILLTKAEGSTFICLCCPLDSENFHTSKHSTCAASCIWVFFSVSFKCHLCLPRRSLADFFKPTDTWVSVIVLGLWPLLPLLTDECLSLISLALSICVAVFPLLSILSPHHAVRMILDFVRDNYWLRSQPSGRCLSLSLFSLSSYLFDFRSVPLAFSFLQSPFVLPVVLAFFSGPCVPLTLSLTHFACAHRWVNHTADLSLNL